MEDVMTTMLDFNSNEETVEIAVQMTAFCNRHTVRLVKIPKAELDAYSVDNMDGILDLVFKYGQNDFQPQELPSVSVGDVIRAGVGLFQVKPSGFKQISEDDLKKMESPQGVKAYL